MFLCSSTLRVLPILCSAHYIQCIFVIYTQAVIPGEAIFSSKNFYIFCSHISVTFFLWSMNIFNFKSTWPKLFFSIPIMVLHEMQGSNEITMHNTFCISDTLYRIYTLHKATFLNSINYIRFISLRHFGRSLVV